MLRSTLVLVIALSLAAAGCGGGETETPATPQAEQPATPPPTAQPSPSPEAAAEPTPSASEPSGSGTASSGNAEAGASTYASFCASCHGPTGESDGPVGSAMNPRPARHADGNYMNPLTDEHLFKVVKNGGAAVGKSPLMTPWGGMLDDQQIWDVVAFMRTLAKPPYQAP